MQLTYMIIIYIFVYLFTDLFIVFIYFLHSSN